VKTNSGRQSLTPGLSSTLQVVQALLAPEANADAISLGASPKNSSRWIEPDFNVSAVMASYESARVVLTGTWMTAAGNQSGDALAADGNALERDGWSVFGEGKISPRWGVIARYEKLHTAWRRLLRVPL